MRVQLLPGAWIVSWVRALRHFIRSSLTEARAKLWDEAAFIRDWDHVRRAGGNILSLAEKYGITPQHASVRAANLRKKHRDDPGMMELLRPFKQGRPTQGSPARLTTKGRGPGAPSKHINTPEFNELFRTLYNGAASLQQVADELGHVGYPDWTPKMVAGRATYLRNKKDADVEKKTPGPKPGSIRRRLDPAQAKASSLAFGTPRSDHDVAQTIATAFDERERARQQARELFGAVPTQPDEPAGGGEWAEKTPVEGMPWDERTPVDDDEGVPGHGLSDEDFEGPPDIEPEAGMRTGGRVRDVEYTDDDFKLD